MASVGVELMARPRKTPKGRDEPVPPQARGTIINLKGPQDQIDWLTAVHRKTHLSKAVILRLALSEWAERHGHAPFPPWEDEE